MEFSQDIVDLLQDKFGKTYEDIENMSLDELKLFRTEVEDLRHEYSLLELGHKVLMNGLYGACANSHFYFFNPNLAADITGECRELTKTMWKDLEHFFHETIWERKDLWKEFDFELDESKHSWYRATPVSIYSDTDSIKENSLILVKYRNQILRVSIKDLFNYNYKFTGVFNYDPDDVSKEITPGFSDIEVLNYTEEKGIHFVPIKYIMKHKVSKEQFKINTKSGKEIIVTGDHSCIVFRNGKQLEIKAKDINKDTDKILTIIEHHEIEYKIEDIESIEQLDNFDNEEVYDIEVDDDSHTFIANDILVHNSVYTTYGNLFKCMTPKYQEKYSSPRSKIDWILNFNKKFLDKQNNKWCEDLYNPRHGQNVHEFELETVSYSQICIKKKKYLKGYAFVKGKFYDKPKVSGTGIELVKSTTPKLCREILEDLMNSLMFEYNEDNKQEYILYFNNKLQEYRKKFYNAPIEDISQSVNVGDYTKYVIEDKDDLIFEKQCPVSVHAIARFNYLAHKNNEDNKKFYSGKIKYYNIKVGNNNGYFGFPAGELPEWAPQMNKIVQWEKTIIDPINRFLEVMNIQKVNSSTSQQLTLF